MPDFQERSGAGQRAHHSSSFSLPSAGLTDLHNLFLQRPVDAVALLAAVSALAIAVAATDTSQAEARPDEEPPVDQQ